MRWDWETPADRRGHRWTLTDGSRCVATDRRNQAQQARDAAADALAGARFGARRDARRGLTRAEEQLTDAQAQLEDAEHAARPAWRELAAARQDAIDTRRTILDHQLIDSWAFRPETAARTQRLVEALDTWHHWATGNPIRSDRLRRAQRDLNSVEPDRLRQHPTSILADTITTWATTQRIDVQPRHPRPAPPDFGHHPGTAVATQPVKPDLGIDL